MNAIILAAGMGLRLRPLTDDKPKALVETAGESFFSRQLRLLHEVGIRRITVVTGYKSEAFSPFLATPGLEFVLNEHYSDRNNLYSMSLVGDRLGEDPEGCLVLEGDVWIGEGLLPSRPLSSSSWFVGYREDMRNEWVAISDSADRVVRIEVASGSGWILSGISYWKAQDGRRIAELLAQAAQSRESDPLFWDEIPRGNLGTICVRARRIGVNDWSEVDTLEDRANLEARIKAN